MSKLMEVDSTSICQPINKKPVQDITPTDSFQLVDFYRERPSVFKTQAKSVEWYTPVPIIEAAKKVFGGKISLDPASCTEANEWIQSEKFFTSETDGLKQDWLEGKTDEAFSIWVNFPYGRGKEDWIKKIVETVSSPKWTSSDSLICLVPNSTETKWFAPLWKADSLCFTNKRISFGRPGEKSVSGNTCGSVLAYFGPTPWAFDEIFQAFGTCVQAFEVLNEDN